MKYIKNSLFLWVMLLSVLLNSGCVHTYKIEKKSVLEFEDAYYQRWTAGVKGGGSGINIYLNLKSRTTVEERKIELNGIYFKDSYAELIFYPPIKFQATIRTKENTKDSFAQLQVNPAEAKKKSKVEKPKQIPFQLKEDEAVISYLENDSKKYVRIVLKKKEMDNFPM